MARGHGGRRRGAGRKPGEKTQAMLRREEAQRIAAAVGMDPLKVMLEAMREAYIKDGPQAAHTYAKDAAPFVHPRLAAVVAKVGISNNPWAEILAAVDGSSRGRLPSDKSAVKPLLLTVPAEVLDVTPED